jgi:hypothetical protein
LRFGSRVGGLQPRLFFERGVEEEGILDGGTRLVFDSDADCCPAVAEPRLQRQDVPGRERRARPEHVEHTLDVVVLLERDVVDAYVVVPGWRHEVVVVKLRRDIHPALRWLWIEAACCKFAVAHAVTIAIEIEYTREKLLGELEQARQVAQDARNGSAMAMATLGKAKILGLIIDRREVAEVGAFDHMTDEELVEHAKKQAAELGLPDPTKH